jgi:hypothetical protein
MTPASSILDPNSDPAAYVAAVLTLYVDLPDTPLRASVPDQRQARIWFDRGHCPDPEIRISSRNASFAGSLEHGSYPIRRLRIRNPGYRIFRIDLWPSSSASASCIRANRSQ